MLSIIIPTLNEAQWLGRQLDAISAQCDTPGTEVIVADNGSTDGTRTVAARYAGRLPLRVVDASARRGAAAARNLGVEAAHGDRLLFCDADDQVTPSWIRVLEAALATADLIAGAIVHVGGTRDGTDHVPAEAPNLLGWMPYAQTANCAVRRSVFDDVGGFPEDLRAGEDVAFSWLAQLESHRFAYEANAVVLKHRRVGLAGQFSQHVAYGRADVDLYIRFRQHGVPPPDLRRCGRTYGGLVARLPLLVSPATRAPWARQAGRRCGRLLQSCERRVFYP